MGALESKHWSGMPPETPQKAIVQDDQDESMVDPRSPTLQYNRTPIVLQEYDESPQNITMRAEFRDPRSPSVKITRTPMEKSTTSISDEVFESEHIDGFANPAFNSSKIDNKSSPVVTTLKKEKNGLKNTSSPTDLRRKNRTRRQSLPQKLFSDKSSTLPRSPLAQRNHSVQEEYATLPAKNKKFTFVPRKRGFISKDFTGDKENTGEICYY